MVDTTVERADISVLVVLLVYLLLLLLLVTLGEFFSCSFISRSVADSVVGNLRLDVGCRQ